MKRNFDAPMLDLEGKPYADGGTLKTVAFMSLGQPLPGDEKQPVAEKLKIYSLGLKLAHGGVVDITAEELALLKDRIGKVMQAFTMGRAFEMLEQDYEEPAAS